MPNTDSSSSRGITPEVAARYLKVCAMVERGATSEERETAKNVKERLEARYPGIGVYAAFREQLNKQAGAAGAGSSSAPPPPTPANTARVVFDFFKGVVGQVTERQRVDAMAATVRPRIVMDRDGNVKVSLRIPWETIAAAAEVSDVSLYALCESLGAQLSEALIAELENEL